MRACFGGELVPCAEGSCAAGIAAGTAAGAPGGRLIIEAMKPPMPLMPGEAELAGSAAAGLPGSAGLAGAAGLPGLPGLAGLPGSVFPDPCEGAAPAGGRLMMEPIMPPMPRGEDEATGRAGDGVPCAGEFGPLIGRGEGPAEVVGAAGPWTGEEGAGGCDVMGSAAVVEGLGSSWGLVAIGTLRPGAAVSICGGSCDVLDEQGCCLCRWTYPNASFVYTKLA